jgi:DHA2 family lincomycin resistance protein-like MFS transporter
VLLPLLGGLAVVGLFVLSQARVRNPLLPLRFLQERTRVSGNLVTLLFFSVFFSQFFITTLYLQDVLGFSALRTGLASCPSASRSAPPSAWRPPSSRASASGRCSSPDCC